MNAAADDLALAVTLRDLAQRAHNARRERDHNRPVEFPLWQEIAVDERDAWIAVARHVHTHYTFKNLDHAQAIEAARLELCSRLGGRIPARECADAARAVLSFVGIR